MANLPMDESGIPIPALALRDGGAHELNIGATAVRSNALTGDVADRKFGARIVSLYATTPCFVKFGDETVVATTSDHYFPNGLYYDFALKTAQTHVSVIQVSTGGKLYISEKD